MQISGRMILKLEGSRSRTHWENWLKDGVYQDIYSENIARSPVDKNGLAIKKENSPAIITSSNQRNKNKITLKERIENIIHHCMILRKHWDEMN